MTGSQTSLDDSDEYRQLLEQQKPGAAIKFLREAKGVSLERIARETLIPDWKLSDLENDAYGGLGGPIFVMGYMRKIARILNVDSDPLIVAFSENPMKATEGEAIAREMTEASEPNKAVRRRKSGLAGLNRIPGPAAIAALLLVWVVVVVYMKNNKQSDEPVVQHEPVVERSVETAIETAEQVGATEVEPTPAADLPVAPVNEMMAETEAEVSPEPLATPVPTVVPTLDSTSPATVSGENLLTLIFSADCWVRVTDATGEVIFAQLQRTGDNLQLFGQAPFDVMLGNARAVEILYNSEAVAVTPLPGRDTLRLTVGP